MFNLPPITLSDDDTTCPEGDENAHFIGSANDKYWRKAPDGMVTNKIVCSIRLVIIGRELEEMNFSISRSALPLEL